MLGGSGDINFAGAPPGSDCFLRLIFIALLPDVPDFRNDIGLLILLLRLLFCPGERPLGVEALLELSIESREAFFRSVAYFALATIYIGI